MSDCNYYKLLNIDVYQGKKIVNVSIDERAKALPTTQKLVLNSMYKLQFDISDGSNEHCHLSMDNRYACPEIAMILRDQCIIYSKGKFIINRK